MSFGKRRPRFDLNALYFIDSYETECSILKKHYEILKVSSQRHIEEQRIYHKDYVSGIPLVSDSREDPTSKLGAYSMEFHPSFHMIIPLNNATERAFQELLCINEPPTTNAYLTLQLRFLEWVAQMTLSRHRWFPDWCDQDARDLFCDVFIENPMLVCQVGFDVAYQPQQKGTPRTEVLEKKLTSWCRLLNSLLSRDKLIETCIETDLLTKVYVANARNLGLDVAHAYIRPMSFEHAKVRPTSTQPPDLVQNESRLERYIPKEKVLCIRDLDDRHLSRFSFRDQENFKVLLQSAEDKLGVVLMSQIVERHLLTVANRRFFSAFVALTQSSADQIDLTDGMTRQVLQEAFVSLQSEKCFYRDQMLNEYSMASAKEGFNALKTKIGLIEKHCIQLHDRFTAYSLQEQTLAYVNSLQALLEKFPLVKDKFFDKQDDTSENDASEGFLDNIYYLPHWSKIIKGVCNEITLRLTYGIHDICRFLFARCDPASFSVGSSTNQKGNWGGLQQIGVELISLQRDVEKLGYKRSLEQVADFLERKRRNLWAEGRVILEYTAPNTFLSNGNQRAYMLVSSGVEVAHRLQNPNEGISHLDVSTNNTENPLFEWNHFTQRYGGHKLFNETEIFISLPITGLTLEECRVVHGHTQENSVLTQDTVHSINCDKRRSLCLTKLIDNINLNESSTCAPVRDLDLQHYLLLLWLRYEKVRREWGRKKLFVREVDSCKKYSAFKRLFEEEVSSATDKSVQYLDVMPKLLRKILEELEVSMVEDTIRKVQEEHTFVLSEQSHALEDRLPTDLWKTECSIENIVLSKSHVLRQFLQKLRAGKETSAMTTSEEFATALQWLGRESLERERMVYVVCTTFYENLVQQQCTQVERREHQIRVLKHQNEELKAKSQVEKLTSIADHCSTLLSENSELWMKLSDLEEQVSTQAERLREEIKQHYTQLVSSLIASLVNIKTKFGRFETSYHAHTRNKLIQVQQETLARLKDVSVESKRMEEKVNYQTTIERLRNEKETLCSLIEKRRAMTLWRRLTCMSVNNRLIHSLHTRVESTQKGIMNQKLVTEEVEEGGRRKVASMKQMLKYLENKCEVMKIRLSSAEKVHAQRSIDVGRNSNSTQRLELLKTACVKELNTQLKQKKHQLDALKKTNETEIELAHKRAAEAERKIKMCLQTSENERHLKLEAFSRVEELQEKLEDLNFKMGLFKDNTEKKLHHQSCLPSNNGIELKSRRPHTASCAESKTPSMPRSKSSICPSQRLTSAKSSSIERPKTAFTMRTSLYSSNSTSKNNSPGTSNDKSPSRTKYRRFSRPKTAYPSG